MSYRIFLTLLLVVSATFLLLFQGDVIPNDGHDALQDIRNAAKEQKRHQDSINEYARLRDLYIVLANDLNGMYSGSLGTTRTILISSLSSAYKGSIANALGLAVRQMLNLHGSSSLQSMIDSAISSANTYQGMIDYLYDNPTKLYGYASANSAMEAYMDGCTATDHYNAYHSSQRENPPNAPFNKPALGSLPTFECPGACTNKYDTVWDALSAHHQKCGTAEPISRILDFTLQQALLAARSVSDGCGVEWYRCDSNHSSQESYHRVRTCKKGVWRTRYTDYTNGKERYRAYTCGDSFRNCMPHTDYHKSSIFKDAHSETDDTSSSNNPVVSPPPSSTLPTPSYHACGVHLSTESGNHSLQASCSSTDGNGNSCTVTSFYACDNHTHVYPSPPPTPTLCPANGWTNCGNTESDATTCGGRHIYYTCNPDAVAYHGDSKSCRRAGCSNTWSKCQSAPWCDAWQGNRCWAE